MTRTQQFPEEHLPVTTILAAQETARVAMKIKIALLTTFLTTFAPTLCAWCLQDKTASSLHCNVNLVASAGIQAVMSKDTAP